MNDPFDLQRFIEAQNSIYNEVLKELEQGQKKSHWMWYVFPQIQGLGRTAMAQRYAIHSREEAIAYVGHALLGERLRECTQLVINAKGRTAKQIFGHPDVLKFRSSMTLFSHVEKSSQIFDDALSKYFEGKPDKRTLDILKNS